MALGAPTFANNSDGSDSSGSTQTPKIPRSPVATPVQVHDPGQYLQDILAAQWQGTGRDIDFYRRQSGQLRDAHRNNVGLLDASRYQNVDLGQMSNAENRRYATQTWQNLQRYLGAQEQNTHGVYRNQLDQYRQMAPLDAESLALQRERNRLGTESDLDSARSAATGRGAMSSRGYQLDRFNREATSAATDAGYVNDYNVRRLNADTSMRTNLLSLADALAQLNNQRATGQNTYQHNIQGTNIQDLMLNSLANTYGLRGQQLAIQLRQALSGNQHSIDTARGNMLQESAAFLARNADILAPT